MSHLTKYGAEPNISIQYRRQSFANGLGAAILLDPFAVLLPDDIFIKKGQPALQEHLDVYENYQSTVIALEKTEEKLLKNYGVVKGTVKEDNIFEIHDIVEKPRSAPPSNLAVCGRYIFESSIFSHLEKVGQGIGGEVQLTDAIKELSKLNKCYGVEVASDRYDIGTDEGYFNLIQKVMSKSETEDE
ncbi:sugar phosphate nucleotidyltransferase [Sutcliffiella halmapala]